MLVNKKVLRSYKRVGLEIVHRGKGCPKADEFNCLDD